MFLDQSATAKKRILIVSPPYRLSQVSFPLGLMYIAAVLQKAGHEVEVIDMDVVNLPKDAYVKELKERRYDYFCTGGMITAWNFIAFSCNVVKQIKPHVTVIVGGGVVSSTPMSLLSVTPADIGCIGEGEETIIDIINTLESSKNLSAVPGIVYKENGEVVKTADRGYIADLDRLPFPAWDLFSVGKTYCRYPSHYSVIRAKRGAHIYTARGCPFQCSFCYTEKRVRYRSIENVIEEIKELIGRFHVGYLTIADDLFVVNKKRVVEFCEALMKNNIRIKWGAGGRCNIIDKEFLKICKAAGCDFLGVGIESGSSTILKRIHKNQTPVQIVEAVKMCHEVGIRPGGTFILGLPGETKETIRETVEIYKTINQYRQTVNRFFFAAPYPGTELYAEVKSAGKIKDEIGFFEQCSEKGDAVDFLVNCTTDLSDSELVRLKEETEKEVFEDFVKKHPWRAFRQWFREKTLWGKAQRMMVMFKMQGAWDGIRFLGRKLLIRLKMMPDAYQRQSWKLKDEADRVL